MVPLSDPLTSPQVNMRYLSTSVPLVGEFLVLNLTTKSIERESGPLFQPPIYMRILSKMQLQLYQDTG